MRVAIAVLVTAALAAAQTTLQIRFLETEGAVHAAGAREPGLAVAITDEVGNPVAGAIVSFRLPEDGAGGTFASGLSSDIVTSGADGRAASSPVRWNRVSGDVQIRITAAKEQLRAATVVTQRVIERAGSGVVIRRAGRVRSGRKWLALGLLAGGAAAAGFAGGRIARGSGGSGSSGSEGVRIGDPAITITKP